MCLLKYCYEQLVKFHRVAIVVETIVLSFLSSSQFFQHTRTPVQATLLEYAMQSASGVPSQILAIVRYARLKSHCMVIGEAYSRSLTGIGVSFFLLHSSSSTHTPVPLPVLRQALVRAISHFGDATFRNARVTRVRRAFSNSTSCMKNYCNFIVWS